jgi:hypothetical protein
VSMTVQSLQAHPTKIPRWDYTLGRALRRAHVPKRDPLSERWNSWLESTFAGLGPAVAPLLQVALSGSHRDQPVVRAASSSLTLSTRALLASVALRPIQIPHPEEVKEYLVRHFDMVTPLLYAIDLTQGEFRDSATFALEVYRDPELPDEYLTLYVRQPKYDDQTIERIKSVRSGLEPTLSNSSGWLLVTTDFRYPA